MAGTIKHAPLESRARRARLKRGRQAHYQAIIPRRLHLGYQRWPDDTEGRWLARRNLGGDIWKENLGTERAYKSLPFRLRRWLLSGRPGASV